CTPECGGMWRGLKTRATFSEESFMSLRRRPETMKKGWNRLKSVPHFRRSNVMPETQESYNNPFNYLIDSFWASLPEKAADDLAKFKKDVLTSIKNTVDHLIEDEIESTNRHLENARRMREQYRPHEAEPAPPNAP